MEHVKAGIKELLLMLRGLALREELSEQGITTKGQLRVFAESTHRPDEVYQLIEISRGKTREQVEEELRGIRNNPSTLLYLVDICIGREEMPANTIVQEWVQWMRENYISLPHST